MNEQDAKLITDFKARIKRISKANADCLKTTFTVTELGYAVEVMEMADRHILLTASGPTIADCVALAYIRLPTNLISWGYVDAK